MSELLRPFTTEWADALRAAINDDAAYRTSSAGWTWPVALVLDAEPSVGYGCEIAVQLWLERGTCTAARILEPSSCDAPIALRASYATWKRVVRGDLDPVMAVMTGKVKLTGPVTLLLNQAGSARALVDCVRAVPTQFPDEAWSG
ncbi:MAG: SCP2 sterol-binding domain-containing protein [Gemmatimonadaceae bacterium]